MKQTQTNKELKNIEEEKESVNFLLEKSEKVFNRNLSNLEKIDSKFIQLFVFVTAIFLFSIQFIIIPSTKVSIILYSFSMLFLMVSIFFIFLGYRTQKYKSVDINKLVKEYISREDKSCLKLKKDVIGILAYRTNYIKTINTKKGRYFDLSIVFIGVAIILFLVLKLIGGING